MHYQHLFLQLARMCTHHEHVLSQNPQLLVVSEIASDQRLYAADAGCAS